MSETRIELQRAIAATPSEIFEILRSPQGHIDIDASGMLMWSDGEPVTAVGDRFVMHMDRDSLRDFPLNEYEVIVVITRFEQDRAIEWTIDGTLQPPIGHVYGYELEETDGGTTVTSYYDWSDIHENYQGLGIFPIIDDRTQLGTLGILARTAAPGRPRPGAEQSQRPDVVDN